MSGEGAELPDVIGDCLPTIVVGGDRAVRVLLRTFCGLSADSARTLVTNSLWHPGGVTKSALDGSRRLLPVNVVPGQRRFTNPGITSPVK
jgi:hypothetical protein